MPETLDEMRAILAIGRSSGCARIAQEVPGLKKAGAKVSEKQDGVVLSHSSGPNQGARADQRAVTRL